MKKLLFATICVCFFIAQGTAQVNNSNDLKLTEAQQQTFLQIKKDRADQMTAILPLRQENPEAFATKAEAIAKQSDDRMKALLNDKQWAAFSRIQNQAKTVISPRKG